MSDSEDEGRELPSAAERARMDSKMASLPTLEGLLREEDPNAFTEAQVADAAAFVRDLVGMQPTNEEEVKRGIRALQKKHRKAFKKSLLLAGYHHLVASGGGGGGDEPAPMPASSSASAVPDVEDLGVTLGERQERRRSAEARAALVCPALEAHLISKAPRSQSGVLVVTVFTSAYPEGQNFSCQWNCYYCPNEPGQPRSYLLNEPGVRRANQQGFDAYRQFEERVRSLVSIGHPHDKVELMVLGGTWESYPATYRERFIRDLFYAANTMFEPPARRRPPLDLLQEQLVNETSCCRIIGVTLETRPDTVSPAALLELRRCGCTRVQLGVQHTDDAILRHVNRQSTREDAMRAIKLLKDSAFKVDIHLMPDLPGATPEADRDMFTAVLTDPYLQADQWKIYPCQTTPFTVIERWFREGRYRPYGLESLTEVLLEAKARVPPWVRLNRVVRDIPVGYVLAGVEVANLRQLLAERLRAEGRRCRCIRCREVKRGRRALEQLGAAVLVERSYAASEGTEVFLSFETADEETIFGFLRLRIDVRNSECPFPELRGCALVRELHVYGDLRPTYDDERRGAAAAAAAAAQHTGIGRRLLARAEALALDQGYRRIAVISGVGVRGYYRRLGYRLVDPAGGAFLVKELAGPDAGPDGGAAAAMSSEALQQLLRERGLACARGALPVSSEAGEAAAARRPGGWRSFWQSLWRRAVKRPREEGEGEGEGVHEST